MIFSSKKDVFFERLLQISENLEESSQCFMNCKINNTSDAEEFLSVMKKYETKGDTYIHELIAALNKTFITPIEREDILQLAMKMDDVLDGLEHWAARLEMYSIIEIDEYMTKFFSYIDQSTIEIAKAVNLLASKRLLDIRPHAIQIKDFESRCDELLRAAIKHLFLVEKDPIQIIKIKELYEMLEGIADSCENVANTLEAIIMRNA